MQVQFVPRLFAALVASALLAACGANLSTGSSPIPAGASGAQSAARAADLLQQSPNAATPSPRPPCYCPPHQRICPDIACLTTDGAARGTDLAPAAATPTPHPPCYCPPSRIPHACPDCAVTSVSVPGASPGDRIAAFSPRKRRAPATA